MNTQLDQRIRTILQRGQSEAAMTALDDNVSQRIRKLAPQNRGGAQRIRRMPLRRLAIAGVAFGVVAIAGAAAAAFGPQIAHHSAAQQTSALRDKNVAQITPAAAAELRNALARTPGTADGSGAPRLQDMLPIIDGKTLLDSQNGSISAAASARGDLCYVYAYGGRDRTSGCVTDIKPTGVNYSELYTGERSYLVGIAVSEITEIDVNTSDGTSHTASLANNAFAWTGQPSQHVVSVVLHRGISEATLPLSEL